MYALPEADIDQRRAVMAGGRVGCVSALRRVGVWGGLDPALHIHVPGSASRLHLDEVTGLGRNPKIRRTDATFWAEPREPRVHWSAHAAAGRAARSWADDWLVDPLADSGPESIVRVRMRRAGFSVEPQIRIPGSSKLDLLINGVVGLDIDSAAWHTGEKQVTWDYEKTLQSFALGRPTLRSGRIRSTG